MFNFNHLYYFYIAARSTNTTIAAHHLRISQPSLSNQIKVLESHLNVKLFRKVGRHNQLTEDGYLVLSFCKKMFEISDQLLESIQDHVPLLSKRIKIGISYEIDRTFVAELVSTFINAQTNAPRPRVSLISGHHEELIEKLVFQEIEAIITPETLADDNIETLVSIESPVMLACKLNRGKLIDQHSNKNNANKNSLENHVEDTQILLEMAESNWVVPNQKSKLRMEIDQFIKQKSLRGRVVFETDVTTDLIRSVADGVGIAFLPSIYINAGMSNDPTEKIGPSEGFWKYRINLGCSKLHVNDPLILSLVEVFRYLAMRWT